MHLRFHCGRNFSPIFTFFNFFFFSFFIAENHQSSLSHKKKIISTQQSLEQIKNLKNPSEKTQKTKQKFTRNKNEHRKKQKQKSKHLSK